MRDVFAYRCAICAVLATTAATPDRGVEDGPADHGSVVSGEKVDSGQFALALAPSSRRGPVPTNPAISPSISATQCWSFALAIIRFECCPIASGRMSWSRRFESGCA